ncbi:Uncharacterized protein PECH_005734 [Penicillium ucsense]|uniref:Uncharacterized protein n=1 Tax=Penicillium ucsense TaxID=2839758 RepID=A0A8J8W3Z9_9EURO|nr:Uncharacterized protein PECM_002906 [Penicillium ucsense]KAF7736148.1 Uncharacterized protein PECH_005734 [Penicillium ucsense]
MDRYLDVWAGTLLGREFWQDVHRHDEQLKKLDDLATEIDSPQSAPANTHGDQPFPTRQPTPRRLSMSDIGKMDPPPHGPSVLASGLARFKALERRVRSPSPRKMMASSISALTSWRLSPVSSSGRRSGHSSPAKYVEVSPASTTFRSEETSPSLVPSPSSSSSQQALESVDHFAIPEQPWTEFPGGSSWENLPRSKTSLGLDLGSSVPEGTDEEDNVLGIEELRPLQQFRGLRSLQLTGMLHSYQSIIWQAVWLMADLDELTLEMALEPEIIHPYFASHWKQIDEHWTLAPTDGENCVYYGHLQDGQLHKDIGHGEYLDKYCMEKAKVLARTRGPTLRQLRLKQLTLSGFVVDVDPFLLWFDPLCLERIRFKRGCIDAGFWVPAPMKDVTVHRPSENEAGPVVVPMVPVDAMRDLKVVNVSARTRVGSVDEREAKVLRGVGSRALYDFF